MNDRGSAHQWNFMLTGLAAKYNTYIFFVQNSNSSFLSWNGLNGWNKPLFAPNFKQKVLLFYDANGLFIHRDKQNKQISYDALEHIRQFRNHIHVHFIEITFFSICLCESNSAHEKRRIFLLGYIFKIISQLNSHGKFFA